MDAIGRIANEIEMLFLVPENFIREAPDEATLSRQQSAFWGQNIRVTLAPLDRRKENNLNHYVLPSLSVRHHPFFSAYSGPRQVAAITAQLQRKPDLVFVQRLAAMSPVLQTRAALPPIFFDLDDVEHKARLRSALAPPRYLGKYAYLSQIPAIHLAERRAARLARAVFVCSELDQRYLGALGLRRVHVVPNAVPLPQKREYRVVQEPTILYLGNYGHAPNIGAAERLIRRIFPAVRARVPGARLLIAGSPAAALPSSKNPPEGVNFLGFVPDLQALYAASRVVCCPITEGGGTRVKIVEAGAYGRPVVSTRVGAEGLNFVADREIILAESDDDLSRACIALLNDAERCEKIGVVIQEKVYQAYNPERIVESITNLIKRGL
ncbi:MAG: glycosyltransferase family 4 protein [Acidibrevibacterium sp.]|uniref:glycosyltransferase family 4 protein n=1 Tax=Acidibrevibacterium sp. TaxID=2606776 RepID=UPI003D056FFB